MVAEQSDGKAVLQRAIELFTTLVTTHPQNPTYVYSLLTAREGEESILRESARAEAVEEQVARLTARYDELTGSVANEAETLYRTGAERFKAGEELLRKGDPNGAVREFREAENASFQSIELQPAEFKAYSNLYAVNAWLADRQKALGHPQEEGAARTAAMHAAQLAAWLAPEADQKKSNSDLFWSRIQMGDFLYRAKRLEESLLMVQEVVTFAEPLAEKSRSRRRRPGAPRHGEVEPRRGAAKTEERRLGRERTQRTRAPGDRGRHAER